MSELEWRRRWKKTLKSCAWQNINVVDSSPLFVKFLFIDDGYEILFSNLTHTWRERLEGQNVERRNKEINPTVEVPLTKLLHHLEEVLQSSNHGTSYAVAPCSTGTSTDGVVLTVSFSFVGLPFVWKFFGELVDQVEVSEHLTEPMMTMICHLTYQRDQLFRLLRNKDKEIFDLKSQGIQTSRKNLETKTFDETSFINEMLTSKEFEDQVRSVGRNVFDDQGQQLYSAVMMKSEWLTDSKETREVPKEEQTFDGPSVVTLPSGGGPSWASNRVPPSLSVGSANISPSKSPSKQEDSKDVELLRRQQLEARLAERDEKEQKKKKQKLKF